MQLAKVGGKILKSLLRTPMMTKFKYKKGREERNRDVQSWTRPEYI
jgi:hypothetical protein